MATCVPSVPSTRPKRSPAASSSAGVLASRLAGVPYDVGVAAAQEVARFTPDGATTAQLALRWIVDQPGVSTVIPGASRPDQARANAGAAALAPLDAEQLDGLRAVYDERIREHVHGRW